MLTRRRFLLGAGAVAVVGAGGGAALVASSDSLQHRLGLEKSPDHRVPDAHVPHIAGQLASRYMGRPVEWLVSEPPGRVLGVVYALHGRGETHRFAIDDIHLDDVAASLDLPLAIASVDGGDHSYWHPRADGTDALRMLLEEFIPTMDARFGFRNRAVLGWSMGGYGALLAAEQRRRFFHAVVAASPALWRRPEDTAAGAFDSADDWREHDVFASASLLEDVPVRIDCGRGDPFHPATKAFADALPGSAGSFGPGFHDAPYWRSVAPDQLSFIPAAMS